MNSCPAVGCQVNDAAERLGDTRPNPHGGEDDLSSSQTAVILQNTSADIAADSRGRFTLFLLSPLSQKQDQRLLLLHQLLPGSLLQLPNQPLLLLPVQRKEKNLQVTDIDTLPNSFPPDTRLQDPEA